MRTLGDLKKAGYQPVGVKEEIRRNLLARLRKNDVMFPGILGFDRTVIPQLQNALLACHDVLLLGLRGQAKSRIIRLIPELLDEYVPVVAGSELNDNPFAPLSKYARTLIDRQQEETPIAWLHRSQRYAEKLATPDTSIADLIGDIDPIKAAQRRLTYADEEVIHFGIIPRTNRGIFAINELPDLQARIQVSLLNILEEQDIQIRGFNIRFPLDIMMIFSANPEDYTNRGNIITPLKDRIESQILTHYPTTLEVAMAITNQEAYQQRSGPAVEIPRFMREIIEQIAFEARNSEYVDQRSGVSARLTRAALEALISNAERRATLNKEAKVQVRISDLTCVEQAITGKVELVYEGEQEGAQNVARLLTGQALRKVFARYFPDPDDKQKGREQYSRILAWFANRHTVTLDPDMPTRTYAEKLHAVDGLRGFVGKHVRTGRRAFIPGYMELVLEALHQSSRLGKEVHESAEHTYADLMGSMLSVLDDENGNDA
ncbi:MAG: AAA family ATPase [Bacteroidota bacterium]|nr:AAA family ATPase [Bacteroidota bacterium]